MSKTLVGMRIAFLATDGVESVELSMPWSAVEEAGAVPTLISIDAGRIQGFDHLRPGEQFDVGQTTAQALPEEYHALVLPGGVERPDRLRTDENAVDFVRAIVEDGTPVGGIGNGLWSLVGAGVAPDRRLTSSPSLKVELLNAGANWVDEEVVIDSSGPNVIVSSRGPDDLTAFCAAIVKQFERPDKSTPSVSGHTSR